MSEALDDSERGVVAGLLRSAIRKLERNMVASRNKWGDEYDSAANLARLALLESSYSKLHGDPAQIANRGAQPAPDSA